MKIKDANFRIMYRGLWYINLSPTQLKALKDWPSANEADGVICIGYIDHECGLTFEVLCCAKNGVAITAFDGKSDTTFKFRYGSVANNEGKQLDPEEIDINKYGDKLDMVITGYDQDEQINKIRDLEALDVFRCEGFPDDMLVHIAKDGLQVEQLWVRFNRIQGDEFCGILLNEPCQDFGVHEGDTVSCFVLQQNDGTLLFICDCN